MPDIVEEPQSRTNHLEIIEIDDSEHEVPGKVGKYAMLSLKDVESHKHTRFWRSSKRKDYVICQLK